MVEFIYKSLNQGHAEYRLHAKEYKKKSHAIKNNDISTIRNTGCKRRNIRKKSHAI